MRFLAVHPGPHFSVHDLYAGWVEGLRGVGQHVAEFNLQDRLSFYASVLLETGEPGRFKRALNADEATQLAVNGLYAAILKVRPHVLFVISGFFVPAELLDTARDAGVRVVLVCTESPYEDSRQANLAIHADVTIVNDPTNLHMFPTGTVYFPHAYRPTLHCPGPAQPGMVCDLGFVGTGYPSRVEFFEAMKLDGLDVLLAGNWQALDPASPLRAYVANELDECLPNESPVDVYRSARCGLNLYRREAETAHLVEGWAMGPREVEMAACGAFFLRDRRDEGDQLLSMLPVFDGPDDAGDQLRWWLAHDALRQERAQKARAAVADRTFGNHARRLVRLLEER